MKSFFVLIVSILTVSISFAEAQTTPLKVKYSCQNDPGQLHSGFMESSCIPPNEFRDSYICYYSTQFQSEFGDVSAGLSLLLPPSVFNDRGTRLSQVCLRSSGAGYSGALSGPQPFTYGASTFAYGQTGNIKLRDCATMAMLGKSFTIESFSGPNPEPWVADDGIRCEVKIGY